MDAIGRRLRWREPQPVTGRLFTVPRDIQIFELIHRHGYLPASYIHRFVGGNFSKLQERLSNLYDWGYLSRPKEQFDSFHARYSYLVYGLTDKSKHVLSNEGRLSPFLHRTDTFVHRLMTACIGASLELAGNYVPRSDVLYRKKSPMELPLPFPDHQRLVPDDLFAMKHDSKYLFFCLEVDRNSEPMKKRTHGTSIEKKLDGYYHALETRLCKEVWDIPGMMVLIATTNERHMNNMAELIRDEYKRYFAFSFFPTFGDHWRVPSKPLDVATWIRADGKTFDITKTAH